MELKLEFNTPDSNSSDSTCQVQLLCLHMTGSCGKRQSKYFSPSSAIFGVQIWALGVNRQRTGGREREACIIIKQSWSRVCLWRIIISVLGLGRVPGSYSLSSLVRINKSLLPDSWSVLHLCYFLPWGQFSPSSLVNKLSVLSFLESQVIARETSSEQKHTKRRQRCQLFLLFLVNLWAQVRNQWLLNSSSF
jgi:hypothetical protein